jgi:hypothetical protein
VYATVCRPLSKLYSIVYPPGGVLSTGGVNGYFQKGPFYGKLQLTFRGKSGKLSISTSVPNNGFCSLFGFRKQLLERKEKLWI